MNEAPKHHLNKQLDNIPDGQTHFAATASTLTYRPLTNPLTGHDAGSNVTVTVAAFTMRTSSKGDLSLNLGTIPALSYKTLYFIYYDDSALAGGSPGGGYVATTTKSTALQGAGRFFVGSIVTPAATAPDTVGNNDGGVGAQFGQTFNAVGGLTTQTLGASSVISNPNSAIDGDTTTSANLSKGASSDFETTTLTVSAFPPLLALSGVATLNIVSAANSTVSTSTNASIDYSLDGGSTWTNVYTINGSTRGKTTDKVTLSASQNLALVQVRAVLLTNTTAANTGSIQLYEVHIAIVQ